MSQAKDLVADETASRSNGVFCWEIILKKHEEYWGNHDTVYIRELNLLCVSGIYMYT